ncbi:hypothetical protein J7K28_05800 [Candidatus Aerophobetes bacterium]|nr:hypothetical protein [Candidatus Aerophobetes bacterium]
MKLGVSYIPSYLPDHIEKDMKYLKEIGCTEVLFALQENHIKTLTGALKFGAKIAKDNGLKPYVVVWGYANTFGGGRMSNILLKDIDMWRIKKDGTPVPLACLNNPKLIDKFIEITKMCRDNGYEGMFIDEPTPQECFCERCQKLFFDTFRKKLTKSEGTEEYRIFQKTTVKNYTETLCKRVKALDKNQKTITCIMPHDYELFEIIASIPELDVFGTDPYWLVSKGKMSLKDACNYAKLTKELCKEKDKSSQIWLNCWKIPAGLEKEIYTGGKLLAKVGCDSLYTWSFRGGLGTDEECEHPEEAWNSVVKLYREISQW